MFIVALQLVGLSLTLHGRPALATRRDVLLPGLWTWRAWAGLPATTAEVTVPAWLQPWVLWWLQGRASFLLLLFLNRRLRAVGPILVALILVLGAGATVAMVASSTWLGVQVMRRVMGMLSLNASTAITATLLAGLALAVPLAWGLGRCLLLAWRRKWISDQTMVFDSIWLLQAALLSVELAHWSDARWAALALLPFATYKTISAWGHWRRLRE